MDGTAFARDEARQSARVLFALREHERGAAAPRHLHDIGRDEPVSRLVGAQLVENLVVRRPVAAARHPNPREHGAQDALEALLRRLLLRVDGAPDRAAEHVERAIEPVGALRRRRQAEDAPRGRRLQNHLEVRSRGMMAFVADHQAVALHDSLRARLARVGVLLDEGLGRGDVDYSRYLFLAGSDLPYDEALSLAWLSGRGQKRPVRVLDAKELGQLFGPLGNERAARHDDERRQPRDEVRPDHGFAEPGGR